MPLRRGEIERHLADISALAQETASLKNIFREYNQAGVTEDYKITGEQEEGREGVDIATAEGGITDTSKVTQPVKEVGISIESQDKIIEDIVKKLIQNYKGLEDYKISRANQ